jgi:hypothetical protein
MHCRIASTLCDPGFLSNIYSWMNKIMDYVDISNSRINLSALNQMNLRYEYAKHFLFFF